MRLHGPGDLPPTCEGVSRSDGRHKVGYEMSWLQLTDPSRHDASAAVRRHLGDHTLSALHYAFKDDARIRSPGGMLRGGRAVHVSADVAGLTPDESLLQYVRARMDSQHVLPLSESSSLVLDLSGGATR
jgi:hypothetical protein